MNFLCVERSGKSLKSDLIFVFTPSGAKSLAKSLRIFPKSTIARITAQARVASFDGKAGQALQILLPGSLTPRIVLIGCGKKSQKDHGLQNKMVKPVFDFSPEAKAKSITMIGIEDGQCGAFSELLALGFYNLSIYKSDSDKKYKAPKTIYFLVDKSSISKLKSDLRRATVVGRATAFTRDLANSPANHLTPGQFAARLRSRFRSSNIEVELLTEPKLKTLKMNALLAVGRGSSEASCLLLLKYRSKKKSVPHLAVVGKGVTFDSGGISIKPSAKMEDMKFDMSGAAAVAGLFDALVDLHPKAHITGVIPMVENMPGGKALKPGDVITAYNGKTIEIINTDAEGRLILADALAYAADRFKPDYMIDLATLTGSVAVALGDKTAGVYGNSSALVKQLEKAGQASGERVWPMPLWDDYLPELDSSIADIKNLGGRWAGNITAAKFLEQFVGKIRWAHIDMAGTAYSGGGRNYYKKGATGFGPRLLLNYIFNSHS